MTMFRNKQNRKGKRKNLNAISLYLSAGNCFAILGSSETGTCMICKRPYSTTNRCSKLTKHLVSCISNWLYIFTKYSFFQKVKHPEEHKKLLELRDHNRNPGRVKRKLPADKQTISESFKKIAKSITTSKQQNVDEASFEYIVFSLKPYDTVENGYFVNLLET